jgi:hypothetical protein
MSSTLTRRMGLAAPSLADASRRLPSVKSAALETDDGLVTSVASLVPVDEPVSPELALVDAELAVRLRALLPEIELQIPLGVESFAPPLRALPDPEPDNVLPFGPPPELLDHVEFIPAPVGPVVPPPLFPSRVDRWRALAKSFAAGAAVATFVTVGVVAKLGEGPPDQPTDAGTVPPRTALAPSPAAGAAAGGTAKQAASAAKKVSGTQRSAPRAAASKPRAPVKTTASKKSAPSTRTQAPSGATKPKTAAAAKPAAARAPAGSKQTASKTGKYPTAAPAAPASRRFAWAPVDGAVGYRIELFRGTKQVLEKQTKEPVFELVSPWRHSGQTERLSSGSYLWYVWPVFSGGPAAKAVVQAQLRVP